MSYNPSRPDESLQNSDIPKDPAEEGWVVVYEWGGLKTLARQNVIWALYNAESLTALAMGQSLPPLDYAKEGTDKMQVSFLFFYRLLIHGR